jgi:hypothetical protein
MHTREREHKLANASTRTRTDTPPRIANASNELRPESVLAKRSDSGATSMSDELVLMMAVINDKRQMAYNYALLLHTTQYLHATHCDKLHTHCRWYALRRALGSKSSCANREAKTRNYGPCRR